ncbi:hypothetical protein NRB_16790 [Novosphingobium sp. 11B]
MAGMVSVEHPMSGLCGGGFGPALQRDPKAVKKDVLDEYVNLEAARAKYGRVLTGMHHRYLIGVPMVKVETLGAGGGSICHVNSGTLQVGPRSAGSESGPSATGAAARSRPSPMPSSCRASCLPWKALRAAATRSRGGVAPRTSRHRRANLGRGVAQMPIHFGRDLLPGMAIAGPAIIEETTIVVYPG